MDCFAIWRYGLFIKPLHLWQANAYAVQLNKEEKTIKCLGGIRWGYKLSSFRLRPKTLIPQPLSSEDWHSDWAILKTTLPGYQLEK